MKAFSVLMSLSHTRRIVISIKEYFSGSTFQGSLTPDRNYHFDGGRVFRWIKLHCQSWKLQDYQKSVEKVFLTFCDFLYMYYSMAFEILIVFV